MKLLFKQRLFSWFDSYDIYNQNGDIVYTVEGKLSWGHRLHIKDARKRHIGTVKQVMLTWMPKFELYMNERYVGCISKELTFLVPKYNLDCNGWQVKGNFLEWDYQIVNSYGQRVATINKELFNFTDTYSIDIMNQEDALLALMVVLAIDAEKCSRD